MIGVPNVGPKPILSKLEIMHSLCRRVSDLIDRV